MKKVMFLVAAIALLGLSSLAQADVTNMGGGITSLKTVPVGNPGNAGETSGNDGWGGYVRANTGKVDYIYNIGKYEVTVAQYCEFLNAVAKTDTYGLYNINMDRTVGEGEGCNIVRTGISGSYTYNVQHDSSGYWANRPVNFVSWGDCVRFVNWLHNGQPTGAQNNTTTEDGAYFINGKTSNADLLTVTRKSGWIWALPTEDEWYKAAYYDPDKGGAGIGGYWDMPMQSEYPSSMPGRSYSGTNDANWIGPNSPYNTYLESYYCRNEVGAFVNSGSAYGTFDQGGNVWERNETVAQQGYPSAPGAMTFGNRGGSFRTSGEHLMWSLVRDPYGLPNWEHQTVGFRVVGPDTTMPPHPGEAYLDNNGILLVDGAPFLPLGYMGVGINDMEAIAQTDSNIIHSYNAYYWTQEESDQYMAEAARLNLKVVLPPWGSPDDSIRNTTSLAPDEITRMTAMVNRYKNHPNFIAWYMSDEPELANRPVSRLREAYLLVRTLDPYHPCIILNFDNSGIETYKSCADIMMPDPYVRPTLTGLAWGMDKVGYAMNQIETSGHDLGAWVALQAFDWGEGETSYNTDRAATLDEFRSMAWMAINHGCKGFIHFAWPYTLNYPDLYLGIPYLHKEIKALSGVVQSPNIIRVEQVSALDVSYVVYNGATWVIVVNTLNQPRSFTITIPGIGNSLMKVVGEDITRQASNGSLSDTLQNYQTRIYTTANPNFSQRIATVRASIAAIEAAKRKPGNFAFWMDNGTTVSASSWSFGGRISTPRGVTNGVISDDEGWRDSDYSFPDWIRLTWPVSKVVGKVVLYSHNLHNFEIQYLNNGNWITLQSHIGDSARQLQTVITFPPVSTTSIRVLIHSANGYNSSISEIECYSEGNYTNPDIFNMDNGITSLENVLVGNPSNAGEESGNDGWGGFKKQNTGNVDYIYKIGKYEVTAAQYVVFLNAVAKTDTYGLYSEGMVAPNNEGCQIYRNGVSGSYTYAVGNNWANRPVNFVSWGDSARFVNWLHNGRPTGAQNSSTTENGVYALNGATSNAALLNVTRKSGWIWALPSEDEWYKAAYYDPDKGGSGIGGYWDMPMQSEYPSSMPGRSYSGTNDANWVGPLPAPGINDFYLEPNYFRNEVGKFINSPSAYGTFDQGGNVWERNETVIQMGWLGNAGAMTFGNRGSCYRSTGEHLMWSVVRDPYGLPNFEWQGVGFRVVAQVFGHTLIGKVSLSNYYADITQVPVTIELGNGSDPIILNLASDGGFTIYDVSDGIYDIRIKASHWLGRISYGFEVTGNSDIGILSLINGDVVESNEVDFDDINVTRAAYGSFPGDENWNERADVDGSGEVDFTDINIVRGNYGEIGD